MFSVRVLASSSSGNCSVVTDGTTTILLDAGISFKEIQRRLNWRISELDGVLVSHEHQ